MSDFRIDAERLWATITETSRFGATPRGGLCRLALSDADREVRDWFRAACEDTGCAVAVDEMGNMFAGRRGQRDGLAPIAVGSHLDTQPTGGRFDGVVGVLAGLELLRTMTEERIETEHPIEVVNWTNEEGARFAPSMLGSGVFAGVYSLEWAYARQDATGQRLDDELDRIGYRGSARCGERRFASFFELHIEQGPVLEQSGETIGVVSGVQSMRWFELWLEGMAAHAGTTPRHARRDASVAAARFIEAAYELTDLFDGDLRATTGVVEVAPGARNVVPQSAHVTLDLRHPSEETLDRVESHLEHVLSDIGSRLGVRYRLERFASTPPVKFDRECVETVSEAAATLGYGGRQMRSGAGHDAVHVARVAPTSMIFVPCEQGLSHNEAENARFEDLAAGAEVLLETVLRRDRALAR